MNCACQDTDNQNIFAYITKDADTFYCHVFQASSPVKINQTLIDLLNRSFDFRNRRPTSSSPWARRSNWPIKWRSATKWPARPKRTARVTSRPSVPVPCPPTVGTSRTRGRRTSNWTGIRWKWSRLRCRSRPSRKSTCPFRRRLPRPVTTTRDGIGRVGFLFACNVSRICMLLMYVSCHLRVLMQVTL